MISRRFFIAAASLAFASACATAPSAPGTTYLAGAHLDATKFLGAPESSPDAQRADLAAVKAAQAFKDGPRWKLAQSDDETSPYSAFGAVLGADFTKARTPRVAVLFDILFADVKSLTGPAKDAFARPRPPLIDPKLETCKPLETTKSYPSGHATRGWLMALVLSDMVPEKANELLARGRDYGDSRVVCAEHFPSDVQAGRLVGAAVFAAARNDPAFERDYKAAKAELRTALALPR
jgi:acid phosphatase (class A)